MLVSVACNVSIRFARSDWICKSNRLIDKNVLLIMTFKTTNEFVVRKWVVLITPPDFPER
jgi:uncharacterized protein (DUF1919 family)